MTHSENEDPTDGHRAAWHAMASSQGLVCVLCGRVPRLERRPDFFDTGLCRDCDAELHTPDGVEAR